MFRLAPLPRLRLNTTRSLYAQLAKEIATGQFHRGDQDIARLEASVGAFIAGPECSSFHAVAMPMARVAIYHALKAVVRPGSGVIMSPYTIADVVNMVIAAGGQPVFADIDPTTANIRVDEVTRLVGSDTGAVLATHFYGCAADIVEIARVCRERNIPLIEDVAQAFGCTVEGHKVGTFGDVGIFSFGMAKNVNAFYGGMAITRDKGLADRMRAELNAYPVESFRTYGPRLLQGLMTDAVTFPPIFQLFSFWFFRWAFLRDVHAVNNQLRVDVDPKRVDALPPEYRRRMSPAQARALLPQIGGVDWANRERIRKAQIYFAGLKDVGEIVLPRSSQDGSHIYMNFPVQAPDRRGLVRYMMRGGADIAESHHRNCADLPCFEAFARECPVARQIAATLVYLPTYPRYDDAEIERNIALIRRFYGYEPVTAALGEDKEELARDAA